MYGSMATGLAIDSSDLDLLVHDYVDANSPRLHQMTRIELIEEMKMLHKALNEVFGLQENTLIETASVPVIKLKIDLVKLCEREIEANENFGVKPSDLDEESQLLNIDITLDEPRGSGDMPDVGGEFRLETNRNAPMGRAHLIQFRRGFDQWFQIRDQLLPCQHQRVVMDQKRAVGRNALAKPRDCGLPQPAAQRDDPAVEFAIDPGAELNRQRGVTTR